MVAAAALCVCLLTSWYNGGGDKQNRAAAKLMHKHSSHCHFSSSRLPQSHSQALPPPTLLLPLPPTGHRCCRVGAASGAPPADTRLNTDEHHLSRGSTVCRRCVTQLLTGHNVSACCTACLACACLWLCLCLCVQFGELCDLHTGMGICCVQAKKPLLLPCCCTQLRMHACRPGCDACGCWS
jgi:hypothetical protein